MLPVKTQSAHCSNYYSPDPDISHFWLDRGPVPDKLSLPSCITSIHSTQATVKSLLQLVLIFKLTLTCSSLLVPLNGLALNPGYIFGFFSFDHSLLNCCYVILANGNNAFICNTDQRKTLSITFVYFQQHIDDG